MVYVDCSLKSGYISHDIVVPACKSYPITGLNKPIGPWDVEVSRISSHAAHEGGKVVSPYASLAHISFRSLADSRAIVWLEGLGQ
jgi:hypothetical protein